MRPKNWTHDKESFFKYTSRHAGRSILDCRKLRWSAPSTFNDPFDLQFDLHIDVNASEVRRKSLDQHWDIIHSKKEFKPVGILGELMEVHRRALQLMPSMSREEFDLNFGPSVNEGIERALKFLPSVQAHLKKQLADSKVLCFSEVRDSLLMWSHYSEHHRGLVLEFRCVREVDSAWGAAHPVKYSERMPRLIDEDLQVQMMSGQAKLEPAEVLNKVLFSKAAEWAYEKEWRIIGGRSPASQPFEDIGFHDSELASVYLGCRMAESEQLEFSALVAKNFPRARIFQTCKNSREFKLDFAELRSL